MAAARTLSPKPSTGRLASGRSAPTAASESKPKVDLADVSSAQMLPIEDRTPRRGGLPSTRFGRMQGLRDRLARSA